MHGQRLVEGSLAVRVQQACVALRKVERGRGCEADPSRMCGGRSTPLWRPNGVEAKVHTCREIADKMGPWCAVLPKVRISLVNRVQLRRPDGLWNEHSIYIAKGVAHNLLEVAIGGRDDPLGVVKTDNDGKGARKVIGQHGVLGVGVKVGIEIGDNAVAAGHAVKGCSQQLNTRIGASYQ